MNTKTADEKAPQRFTPADELSPPVGLPYVVKGLIPQASFTLLFGPPGCGKSAFALDLAYRLGRGDKLVHGLRAKPGKVIYTCLEGQAGAHQRLLPYREQMGSAPDLIFDPGPLNLFTDEGLNDLISEARAQRALLVIIDTWAQTIAGADEKSDDQAVATMAVQRIINETGAGVMAIAHSGHNDKTRPRGWSGLVAVTDSMWRVDGAIAKGPVRISPVRAKDTLNVCPIGFATRLVDIGHDEDGEVVTGFIGIAAEPPQTPGSAPHRDVTQDEEFQRLASAITESSNGQITKAEARRALGIDAENLAPDTARQRLSRCLKALKDAGVVDYKGNGDRGAVWLTTDIADVTERDVT